MRRSLLLLLLLALFVACPGLEPPPADDDDAIDDDDDAADNDDTPSPQEPAAYHPALEDLTCAQQLECAEQGPFIEGTCCTYGDNLVAVATGQAAEAVDIDVSPDGRYAILCGGFGARINDVSTPSEPRPVGSAGSRCQRAAWGDAVEGGRIVYIAHHGDSWVTSPSLSTWRVSDDDQITQVTSESTPGVLYEGLAWGGDHLYVAAHAGGLRVYSAAGAAAPTLVGTLDGFTNASKLALRAGSPLLYVGDDEVLRVVDVSAPSQPQHAGSASLISRARDVHVLGGRAYVALGGQGVDVFDLATPTAPSRLATIAMQGSAQAVHADGDLLAVAAWRYAAMYDTRSLKLVGTEELRGAGQFEQDFGVDLRDGHLFVAEWERMHVLRWRPGFVAPDLWLTNELFDLPAAEAGSRTTRVVNRGPLPLQVRSIASSSPALTVSATSLDIAPGQQADLTLTYTPPETPGTYSVTFESNDPDPGQASGAVSARLGDSARVDVGEPLGPEWGFLDPTGQGDVANLQGKVVFLAYFALF